MSFHKLEDQMKDLTTELEYHKQLYNEKNQAVKDYDNMIQEARNAHEQVPPTNNPKFTKAASRLLVAVNGQRAHL